VRVRGHLDSPLVSDFPQQVADLDISEVEDGLVVFEPTARRVHHLNVTLTLVFELCTGGNSVEQIESLVQAAFALPAPPTTEVSAALASLRTALLVA